MSDREVNKFAQCSEPIDAAVLADYWLGLLAEQEEQLVEEHLLGCDHCGERLREMMALSKGIREIASKGALRMIVSDEFLHRAAKQGARVREYAPPNGGQVECTVTAEDDILIGRLAVNLSGAKRVDLSLCDVNGVEMSRLEDIPINPKIGNVVYHESIDHLRALPTSVMVARLIDVGDDLEERTLGVYTFNHTRTLP